MRRRPKAVTQEAISIILEGVVEGRTVRGICEDESLPARSTIYSALANNADFAQRYGMAKAAALESLADEILAIADESSLDWMQTKNGVKVDREAVERSKIKISTRQWLMARLSPTRYGNRTIIDNSGDEPVSQAELLEQIRADAPVNQSDEQGPRRPVL